MKHKRGDTFNGVLFRFTYKEIDGVIQDPPIPIDLTDATIKSKFKFGSKNGKISHEFDLDNGIDMVDAEDGQIRLLTDMLIDWEFGDWYYDIQITFQSGVVKTYYEGTLTIVQDITNGYN